MGGATEHQNSGSRCNPAASRSGAEALNPCTGATAKREERIGGGWLSTSSFSTSYTYNFKTVSACYARWHAAGSMAYACML